MANGGFKSSENLLGQTLLHLSASGSSIIAELLRLSQNIPDVFTEKAAGKRYEPVLFGFEYQKIAYACSYTPTPLLPRRHYPFTCQIRLISACVDLSIPV